MLNLTLDPRNKKPEELKPAFIATERKEDQVVCLMAKYENSGEPKNSAKWFIDSGCGNHMTYEKIYFLHMPLAIIPLLKWVTITLVKFLGKE